MHKIVYFCSLFPMFVFADQIEQFMEEEGQEYLIGEEELEYSLDDSTLSSSAQLPWDDRQIELEDDGLDDIAASVESEVLYSEKENDMVPSIEKIEKERSFLSRPKVIESEPKEKVRMVDKKKNKRKIK